MLVTVDADSAVAILMHKNHPEDLELREYAIPLCTAALTWKVLPNKRIEKHIRLTGDKATYMANYVSLYPPVVPFFATSAPNL